MSNHRKYFHIFVCLIIMNLYLSPFCVAEGSNEPSLIKKLEKEIDDLKELAEEREKRLRRLEPPEPVDIQDPPWGQFPSPSKIETISEVIHKGTKIP